MGDVNIVNMEMSEMVLLWSLSVVIICVVCASREDGLRSQVETHTIEVKPGAGPQKFSRHSHGVDCTFAYKAQGGTKEEWLMTIAHDSSARDYACTAERPGGRSYLFFEEFKLRVTGAKLQSATAEKEPGLSLQASEYKIDKHSIYHVDTMFQSQLSRVQIFATTKPKSTHSKDL